MWKSDEGGTDRMSTQTLNGRDRALLRAVAAGRCELDAEPFPVLLVDGVTCADLLAGDRLLGAGLLVAPGIGRAPAALTPAGQAALA